MTDIEFCCALIGKPWVSGARGPDTFDCWGLVCHIYRERKGLELAIHASIDAKNLRAVLRASSDEIKHWQELQVPEHFCVALMSGNCHGHHVGLWVKDGEGQAGILHTFDGAGVVFQHRASLQFSGIQNIKFYRHIK